MQPVGPGGYSSSWCTHLGLPGLWGPYPGSGLEPPTSLVGGLGLTVAGMHQ